MIEPAIGSMFSGYGGLDMAVIAAFGGEVAWFAENNPDASKVLAHHWPDVPNLGDVTGVEWATVSPIDILAAGFPCQNISNAGDRKGITGDRSRLWKDVVNSVRVLRPKLVVLENVAAIRTRGFGVVACDLAALGYDTVWTCVRASEIGAPHRRDRWFCIARAATSDTDPNGWSWGARGAGETGGWPKSANGSGEPAEAGIALLPTPMVRDWKSAAGSSKLLGTNSRPLNEAVVNLLPTPKATDGTNGGPNQRDAQGRYYLPAIAVRLLNGIAQDDAMWREYAPAVRRWERITGIPAPEPTEPAPRGGRRLSPALPEWMMGLPPGHVTDVPDIKRNGQLRVIGGGVVPQQAIAAIRWMADQPSAVESNAA